MMDTNLTKQVLETGYNILQTTAYKRQRFAATCRHINPEYIDLHDCQIFMAI